jgi:hypothetical protein|mmetsp:Transcript_2727/g.8172  ORF Transcript_2727/g.8172 Transcript_2727/m.8172 type:complete len:335 (-) Transcript_2727:356-1360(-)
MAANAPEIESVSIDGGKIESPASREIIQRAVRAYFYVTVWMTCSISVIVFNKWLLAYTKFHFPITLTGWHMAFCSLVGFVCIRVLKITKSHNMSYEDYMRRVLPIGLLYAASLWMSNASYIYLSVSFIQMTKSLMPGLVYVSGIWLGNQKFRLSVAANMCLIALGVVVCGLGEENLVLHGLAKQLTALMFEATRLAMIEILINRKGMKMDPLQSLYYVCPACFCALAVPFYFVEYEEVAAVVQAKSLDIRAHVLLLNGLAAFALNIAVFLLIGKTSALTMNIAGVIKDWMLIFFSYFVFKAPLTALNLGGYVFCCAGVVLYQFQKYRDMHRERT